jgi:transcriptional regulator with XRE-family HTH domain
MGDSEVNAQFATRLRDARRRTRTAAGRRMTQADLATAVGVERNTVSRWELGRVPRQREVLERLAGVLGVSPEWLLGEEAQGRSEQNVSGPDISVRGRTELPPEVAKAARRLVDAFKREMAIGGATAEELHYIETVLMTPNLPPTLAGGAVQPDQLLEHIQGLMEPIRGLLRAAGRKV